jgi:hypothetical protein
MVNQGSATTITVDGDEPAGTGRNTAALMRFSLPTLPAGATITDTKLRLNVTNSSTNTYYVFVMKKAWVEGQATWNMYRTSSVWDLAGGRGATDREAPAIASIAPDSTGVQYFDLGAAFDQQVGDWMSGEEANNGIQLINTDAQDGFDFSTQEVATASLRPQLIITYDEGIVADTTPPETTITSGAAEGEPLTVDSATFGFSSSESGSTFECSLDGGAFASCGSPQSYTNLSNGSHTFSVRATDAAGNVDATPASRTFSVEVPPPPPADTTPPETTIDSGPSDTITVDSASFAFSSSEAGSTFECRLDSATFSSCTSPEGYTNLSDGSHTFEVRATDAAGNLDPTPASYSWMVDTTAPETTIDSGPTGIVNSNSASFTFSSSETNSIFECKLDAGTFASCTSPKAYDKLSGGSHTFSVRATDAAGNIEATPATRTWMIETILPPPPDTSKLAWAPPVLTNPITVNVPANDTRYGNGVTKVVLASGQDARINLPSTTKVGGLWIEGGRNVIVIGGHIQPNPNHSMISGSLGMRGIYVKNNTGVVHIEGVLIDSPDDREYDAMEVDSGQTTLQLENDRFLKVAGTRDTNHGDILLPYNTGLKVLRVDRLTASSRYQGWQLYDRVTGGVDMRRVDVTARPQTSGTSGGHMVWVGNDACVQNAPYTFSEVYVTPRPDRTLGNSVWPTSSASGCPAQVVSNIASWPLFLAITGGVALGPPPGGEFVPAGVAGLHYVSPGYQQ